ncbi:hypothetical protein K449DRAFT_384916 [Hypoxylon sp. EC38]|nr:hypothetical protein K449DRAFT_384916 [Hypoxylon sp. EC38]
MPLKPDFYSADSIQNSVLLQLGHTSSAAKFTQADSVQIHTPNLFGLCIVSPPMPPPSDSRGQWAPPLPPTVLFLSRHDPHLQRLNLPRALAILTPVKAELMGRSSRVAGRTMPTELTDPLL